MISPALDNDEYRRGRRTTHIVYGEAMSNPGEAMHCSIMPMRRQCVPFEIVPAIRRSGKTLQILTKKTGFTGCLAVSAWMWKLQAEISREKLDFIYRLKTSALIRSVHDGRCGTGTGRRAEIK